jgi:hypothetical protein
MLHANGSRMMRIFNCYALGNPDCASTLIDSSKLPHFGPKFCFSGLVARGLRHDMSKFKTKGQAIYEQQSTFQQFVGTHRFFRERLVCVSACAAVG